MIYSICHITQYSYETGATSAKLALHLTPQTGYGQNCLSHNVFIDPNPQNVTTRLDFFGNVLTLATIEYPSATLRIEARSRLQVSRQKLKSHIGSPAWADVAKAALLSRGIGPDAPAHFMFQSRLIRLHPEVTAYAAASFLVGQPIVEGVRDLARRIKQDFAYQSGSTTSETTLEQAFYQRRGVCQDFSHIMIAGLRGLGIPASYVSGYLRTLPPLGAPRIVGADASHAWVGVWCGTEIGWFDIDPTNACDVGNDHVVLARGRDFSDVSPIYGVFVGSGTHGLSVSVDVAPEAEQ